MDMLKGTKGISKLWLTITIIVSVIFLFLTLHVFVGENGMFIKLQEMLKEAVSRDVDILH